MSEFQNAEQIALSRDTVRLKYPLPPLMRISFPMSPYLAPLLIVSMDESLFFEIVSVPSGEAPSQSDLILKTPTGRVALGPLTKHDEHIIESNRILNFIVDVHADLFARCSEK